MTRLGRLAIWILASVVTVAIADAAARLTWSLAGETGAPVADIAAALAEPADEKPLDLTPIFVLAPFGTPATAAAPEPVAQETSLGLVLRGITITEPLDNSVAVIASDDGVAKLYGIGDSVEGKATLIEVMDGKAMLQVGDRVESLSFPKPGEKVGVKNILAKINDGGNGGGVTTASVPKVQTPVIEDYRRKIAANPKAFLDNVGIAATKDGYAISENASSSLLRTGLRPGDLIAKVNGEAVGDIERDRDLLDKVITSGKVRVEVVRDGRTVVMSFPLQ